MNNAPRTAETDKIIQALIEARRASGMTQKELSEITGIAQGDISKLETGNVNPSLPKSPKYLTPAMREIRDPGFLPHLAIQKKANANNKVVIVHGLDDDSCNPADKMLIAANMVRAGFRPDTYFLTPIAIDGTIVQSTGHSIGNRPEVISKFGGAYLAESGKFALQRSGKSDLDMRHEVVYPVTGGRYIISYAAEPVIRFEKD